MNEIEKKYLLLLISKLRTKVSLFIIEILNGEFVLDKIINPRPIPSGNGAGSKLGKEKHSYL